MSTLVACVVPRSCAFHIHETHTAPLLVSFRSLLSSWDFLVIEMARWDEILTLPVQNPPAPEFSSADVVWSHVEGWQDGVDRVALIPFSRVNDFVRGESNMKECPTKFHVEARRRRPPEMPYKPKVDGILEYILYWCSFGPDDHRKGGVVRPSRNYTLKRKTPAGRPSTKRGCVCHFIVKRLIAEPSIALIIYNHEKHVDKSGVPCHGPQDQMAVGTNAMFAPYISEELRLQVMSLLYVGVPVETIMQRHTESVEKQGGPCNRDDLLTHRYVRRLERKIRRSSFQLDPDDTVSINLWIEGHRNHVFYHKDISDSEPLALGIQTEWQLQQMVRFGNRSLLASDSRLGTNKLKYPIHTLLVFDSKNNAIPVAWIITPQFASGDIHKWLRALYDRVRSKDPTWKLGGFIVDDPSADVNAIRDIFQCSVLLSFWRVRQAWHKNLVEKCPEKQICVEISRRLEKALTCICRDGLDVDIFDDLLEDFVDCLYFMDYFKATWLPRMGIWSNALKALPLASLETSAAIEFYHNQLKLRLLNENDPTIYQRADWLVYKLATKVHSYYWLDEYAGKDSFTRYWKDEWKSGLTSWNLALQISDLDVDVDSGYAKVASQNNQDQVKIVQNPASQFAICGCNWSSTGNLCKHAIKTNQVCRNRGLAPSISLFVYRRTLASILACPPHESLLRDHAVALAISVQTQLKSLHKIESSGATPSDFCPNGNLSIPTGVLPSGIAETGRSSNEDDVHMNPKDNVPGESIIHNMLDVDADESSRKRFRCGSECALLEIAHDNNVINHSENENDASQYADDEVVSAKAIDSHLEKCTNSSSKSTFEVGIDTGELCHVPAPDILLSANSKEINGDSEHCFNSITVDAFETESTALFDSGKKEITDHDFSNQNEPVNNNVTGATGVCIVIEADCHEVRTSISDSFSIEKVVVEKRAEDRDRMADEGLSMDADSSIL